MRKTKEGHWIGKGEDSAFEILKVLFPDSEVKRQVLFSSLMSLEFKDTLGERQEKETLDLVVFRPSKSTIVVRVQDKHHNGSRITDVDLVQKKMLEWNDCIVVDLWFHDCIELFKDNINDISKSEVVSALVESDINLRS